MHVAGLACLTLLRVVVLIALASLVWVPIGVWVGLRPRATAMVQPIAQFLAAFPANLLFPVVVFGIVSLEAQSGHLAQPADDPRHAVVHPVQCDRRASAMPTELRYAAQNLGVSGTLWWRTVALPGVLPYYVTGAITASGGAWNASVVAEVVSWGTTQRRGARPRRLHRRGHHRRATSTASSSASRP